MRLHSAPAGCRHSVGAGCLGACTPDGVVGVERGDHPVPGLSTVCNVTLLHHCSLPYLGPGDVRIHPGHGQPALQAPAHHAHLDQPGNMGLLSVTCLLSYCHVCLVMLSWYLAVSLPRGHISGPPPSPVHASLPVWPPAQRKDSCSRNLVT